MMNWELFRQILEIDSTSGKEREMALWLQENLEAPAKELMEVGDGTLNLLLSWGTPRVVFCTHMDTVPPYIPPTFPEKLPSGGTPFASLTPAPPIVSCVPFGNLSPTGPSPCPSPGVDKSPGGSSLQKWTVRLKMIDVKGITPVKGGYFLNTGTRHFVKLVDSVETLDMEADAKPLRWAPAFQPEGANVNLVEARPDGLHVRTFEKGVEGETLACGTGLTASALAAYHAGIAGTEQAGRVSYRLQCRRGDWLQVDFQAHPDSRFTDVYLTGPAELVRINFISL